MTNTENSEKERTWDKRKKKKKTINNILNKNAVSQNNSKKMFIFALG